MKKIFAFAFIAAAVIACNDADTDTTSVDTDTTTTTTTTTRISAMEGMEQPLLYWIPSVSPSGMAFVEGSKYKG